MINIIKIILKCLTPFEVKMNKLLLFHQNAYSVLVKGVY